MQRIDPTTSSFESLITDKCVYVDKTRYLYNLITRGARYYFLSRPRRFGKSLTVSTLKAIFKGKKELFKDLYIGKTDYDFKEYPVVHIDFSNIDLHTAEEFRGALNQKLFDVAREYNIDLPQTEFLKKNWSSLIVALSHLGKVVVLVDEYDKPLSDNINNEEEISPIRDVLRDFFEVLKSSYDYIRFVFITGVTKYSKVSVFSSMNNLFDLSVNKKYATLLGYTQEELEHYFAEGIDEGCKNIGLSRAEYLKKIKFWYDGYRFAPGAENVYNPISIGYFFEEDGENFNNYWSKTGDPKLLYDVAKQVKFNVETDIEQDFNLDTIQSQDIVGLAATEVSKHNYNSLLFQAGYLTIKEDMPGSNVVSLGFPNEEISRSFATILLPLYFGENTEADGSVLLRDLNIGDVDAFLNKIKAIFAGVPYNIIGKYEYSFQTGFYCILKAMGAKIEAEVPTNKGRIDATVETKDHIYIFEFKVNQSATVAIEQIKAKGYPEKFNTPENKGKILHLMGVSFSEKNRNFDEILHEEYALPNKN